MRIDSIDAPLVFQTADRSGNNASGFDLYKNTQAQLIRTPFVLNKALADTKVKALDFLNTKPDALSWLSKNIEVEFPGQSEVMAISLTAPDGPSAAAIVDAVVQSYMNEAVLDERNERLQRVDSLERVYAEAEGKVRARRADIRKLADTLGTGDSESLSLAQQLAVERYGQVQSELGNVDFSLMKAEGELDAYRQLSEKMGTLSDQLAEQVNLAIAKSNENGVDSALNVASMKLSEYERDRLLSGDGMLQRLRQESRAVREEIELYKQRFGEGMLTFQRSKLDRISEDIQKREEEVLRLSQAEKERQSLEGNYGTDASLLPPEQQELVLAHRKLSEDKQEKDQIVSEKEIQVGILRAQRKRIESDLAGLDVEAKKLGRSSIDIEMMRAEIASLDEVLGRLSSEIERTKIELKSGGRITIVSEAIATQSGSPQERLAGSVGLGVLGFVLPLLGLIALDLTRKPINGTRSVVSGSTLPVLGSVPRQRGVSRVLNEDVFSDGAFGNSVSSIVAMLVNLSRFDHYQVIMVTSAVAGEGKSTLSKSLWRGLAEANSKVILVDFDLRRPDVHRQFDCELGVGTSDVVAGNANWRDAIHTVTGRGDFITAGSNRPINLSAVANHGLPMFLNELRKEYDFVIVDTPPVLPVVDTRVIGEHADTSILAVLKDRSRIPQLVAANETLLAHGIPVMGVVVNACGERTSSYSYQY